MALSAVRFVGVTAESGTKLLLTVVLVTGVLLLRWALARVLRMLLRGGRLESARFWSRQVLNLAAALVLVLGGLSIWFDDPGRLVTALGLVTAGLAFALQRVVTALAGYLVILRGDMFSVGDRITMGGVRGDVVRLGFTKTTVMEVGQPIDGGGDGRSWVRSRQYTGRLVTVRTR
ncbi:MAG TPA: mechanosensitive ion channel domain-containing protein [Frankiaceae bacterium]|nr:mechanosensitive ion channel domain-containing protein [Frankiaceae bacterium]